MEQRSHRAMALPCLVPEKMRMVGIQMDDVLLIALWYCPAHIPINCAPAEPVSEACLNASGFTFFDYGQ